MPAKLFLLPVFWVLISLLPFTAFGARVDAEMSRWFETLKAEGGDEALYRFLYAMPKGGDLHNHMSGSVRSEWFYEMALDQADNGYIYYTKVRINNCREYGGDAFGGTPYLLMFVNLQESSWEQLPECERREYERLQDLAETQKEAWLDSLRLDKGHEGRDEFFETHWQRMNELYANPHIAAESIVRNMEVFGEEGLLYLEPQVGVRGFKKPDGSAIEPSVVADIFRERLGRKDARDTGVTVRFQVSLLRFAPDAEQQLRWLYDFVYRNRDLWVAVNMVGREDNDKGYPLRFLETLRDLRRKYHGVRLSIHAGEVDEPNDHVRDTLLLGAERIGHGLNLITDPDTMRLMQHGPYLVEINLISNLLLEYVDDYSEHPFPEYLRTGIPVALSTDDRGMWDSNMTDEFFVAVREYNLSWAEVVELSRNSLLHSFAPKEVRERLLSEFDRRIGRFSQRVVDRGFEPARTSAESYGFVCRHYQLCDL